MHIHMCCEIVALSLVSSEEEMATDEPAGESRTQMQDAIPASESMQRRQAAVNEALKLLGTDCMFQAVSAT